MGYITTLKIKKLYLLTWNFDTFLVEKIFTENSIYETLEKI